MYICMSKMLWKTVLSSLKCLCMMDVDLYITYLKNTKLNLVSYLTVTKIF